MDYGYNRGDGSMIIEKGDIECTENTQGIGLENERG